MLESKVQSYIIKELKKNGWFVRKIAKTSSSGDPDIYSFKDGVTVWIETKRQGEKARELQKYRHNEIRSFGMKCIVISGIDEAKDYIENL